MAHVQTTAMGYEVRHLLVLVRKPVNLQHAFCGYAVVMFEVHIDDLDSNYTGILVFK